MIYIFGDLRQLRSFELVRPPISHPQRLRPLRNNTTSVRDRPPEPAPLLVPITRPPIPPKPVHDPEKSSTSPPFLSPILEPVSPSFSSSTGLQTDTTNPRVTLSTISSGSFTSGDPDASRASTPSSDDVGIHISEAFYDIEPTYLHDDFTSSSPVPSSWCGESPANTPRQWTPNRTSYNTDSALPITSDSEQEKWVPTAGFIKPFEYNEWQEWDGESLVFTAEGSFGGYSAGDEESRISHFVRPTSLRQDGTRTVGTRVHAQFRVGSRRGTTASSKISRELGIFDFDALPAFQPTPSPIVAPALQRRSRYRTCDASPPPPPLPHHETTLTGVGGREGMFRTWLVDLPRLCIRRTQGKCGAAKQVIRDVLTRSAAEASRRNGGENEGEYRDAPETEDIRLSLSTAAVPRPLSYSHPTPPQVKEKGRVNWRTRWKRALTVPAFKSPLTRVLSPVVSRAQWEAVVRSGVLAFVASFVLVAILVAVPVP